MCVSSVIDGKAPRPSPATHGTAVCDSGALEHKKGGCKVQQPAVDTPGSVSKDVHSDTHR